MSRVGLSREIHHFETNIRGLGGKSKAYRFYPHLPPRRLVMPAGLFFETVQFRASAWRYCVLLRTQGFHFYVSLNAKVIFAVRMTGTACPFK
jgi:hypothetical protein